MGSAVSKKYRRDFIIFSNEDSGYEEGKKPSGHLVIEVRDKTAKVAAVMQNLRNGGSRFGYALYMIRTGKGTEDYVRAGGLRHSGSRSELDLVLEHGLIPGTIYSVDDFDTFAVIAEPENKPGTAIACPLAAYRNGRTDWRSGLRRAMQEKLTTADDTAEDAGEDVQRAETASSAGDAEEHDLRRGSANSGAYAEDAQTAGPETAGYEAQEHGQRVVPVEMSTNEDEHDRYSGMTEMVSDIGAAQFTEVYCDTETDHLVEAADTDVDMDEYRLTEERERIGAEELQYTEAEDTGEMTAAEAHRLESAEESEAPDNGLKPAKTVKTCEAAETDTQTAEKTGTDGAAETSANETSKRKHHIQDPPGIEYKYPGSAANIDMECVYLNGNICGAVLNAGAAVGPCGACRINRHEPSGMPEERVEGNIDGLEEELARSFDVCDPFHSRRSDYIWWRVTDPVDLNNMFFRSNIRSPFMFNQEAMMSHYKYKHLIVGIFTHKAGQRYVICGAPGMYMVDPNPFGETAKWIQAEENRQRYGAFGYWLLYIDPKDSKVISF